MINQIFFICKASSNNDKLKYFLFAYQDIIIDNILIKVVFDTGNHQTCISKTIIQKFDIKIEKKKKDYYTNVSETQSKSYSYIRKEVEIKNITAITGFFEVITNTVEKRVPKANISRSKFFIILILPPYR